MATEHGSTGDERRRELERAARTGDPLAASALAAAVARTSDDGRRYLPPVHVSAETAYVQPDYPYSFRLRCQRRVWIETKKGHGQRAVYQTSNPKRPGTWNKPKPGTYSAITVLYLDAEGHLQGDGLRLSDTPEGVEVFATRAAAALTSDWHRKAIAEALAVARAYSRLTWTVAEVAPIDLSDRAALDKAAAEQEERQARDRKVIRAAVANELAAMDGRPLPVPSLGTAATGPRGGDR